MAQRTMWLAGLLGVAAFGHTLCMEEKKSSLNENFEHILCTQKERYLTFKLNQKLEIESSDAHNMEYFIPKEKFMGKDILAVIPLSETDYENLANGFDEARKSDKTVEVPYTLEESEFKAYITYCEQDKQPYRVKVTPVKE